MNEPIKLTRLLSDDLDCVIVSDDDKNYLQNYLGKLSDWEIDMTTGRPVLTYQKCSVIQDETAHTLMTLVKVFAAKGITDRKTS